MADDYRNKLIQAEQKSQDDYDKSIVSLSGGALGISLIFYKEVIGGASPNSPDLLVWSWGLWAASIAAVVLSYFLSRFALRKAIHQADENNFSGGVGGWAANCTNYVNALSGVLFVIGIILFIIFSSKNIEGYTMSDPRDSEIFEKGYIPPPPPPKKESENSSQNNESPPPPPENEEE